MTAAVTTTATATWHEFSAEAPEFAARVRRRIEDQGLGLLATLRADGSPRISGIEPVFDGGELWLAMMPRSAKGADLRRDGRFALHNATVDKDVKQGDVKINGVASVASRPLAERPPVDASAELFATSLTDVTMISVGEGVLVVETWRPGRGVNRRTRV